ncbi:MAG: hypothetical protein V2A56_08625 [bacterium]
MDLKFQQTLEIAAPSQKDVMAGNDKRVSSPALTRQREGAVISN